MTGSVGVPPHRSVKVGSFETSSMFEKFDFAHINITEDLFLVDMFATFLVKNLIKKNRKYTSNININNI